MQPLTIWLRMSQEKNTRRGYTVSISLGDFHAHNTISYNIYIVQIEHRSEYFDRATSFYSHTWHPRMPVSPPPSRQKKNTNSVPYTKTV